MGFGMRFAMLSRGETNHQDADMRERMMINRKDTEIFTAGCPEWFDSSWIYWYS